MTSDAPLRAQSLHRFFHSNDDETQALRDVSLQVAAGELVVIIGPSGSGKSTLLSCLAGVDEPDGGSVHVGGERMSRRTEATRAALRARHIGILTQRGDLFAHLSVQQNVQLAQRVAGARSDIGDLLDEVGIAHRARAIPATLSGGESLRAALAVALANSPAVVIADEPTGELDSIAEAQLLDLLRRRTDRGTAVLVASHSEAVNAAADRVLHMDSGRLS